jgi:hypothetical protein
VASLMKASRPRNPWPQGESPVKPAAKPYSEWGGEVHFTFCCYGV